MRNGPPGIDPAVTSTTAAPRATKRGLGSRLSGGHLLMIVAGLLAFVLTLVALSDRGSTVTVAVATTDLAPGTAITESVVKAVELPSSSPLASSLVRYEDVATGPEQYTSRRVPEGEPISKQAVAGKRASANQREVSIAVDPANAVGGEIAAGDIIDVIAVASGALPDESTGVGPTGGVTTSCRIVAGAEVLHVSGGSSSGLAGTSGGFSVTIAVPRENSELVTTAAKEGGSIHLVRATGAPLARDGECYSFPARGELVEPGPRVDGTENGES